MTQEDGATFILTNVHVFHAIAHEAYTAMKKEMEMGARPKSDGAGFVHTFDPDQKSFKNALTTIVFSGVCLEAALHLLIVARTGIDHFKKVDRETSPFAKLKLASCDDQTLLDLCLHYQTVRREIVHEKAHLNSKIFRTAQDEAEKAINLIDGVFLFFGMKKG